MKLKTRQVEIEYHGEQLQCEETLYACEHCDFELHLDWMKDKMQQNLEEAYRRKQQPS